MIFVTGGAGYIGSHTCLELLQAGHGVTVYDNFCNSHRESLARVERITGKSVHIIEGDIRDGATLQAALRETQPSAVVHFAGLKAVGESVQQPLRYYDNNVVGTVRLLEAMEATGVRSIVFSSSATVYGDPQRLPLTEDHPFSPASTYGQTKLVVENMLRELHLSNPVWRVAILRYFNPVGAHASGLIGEDPQGIPNNLMPYVTQVAIGQREYLNVWGGDYPTPDGTGVRDYIHVVDLAVGHVKAIDYLGRHEGCTEINLGTGKGCSVLEVVKAASTACGREIPYRIAARRAGDVPAYYADPEKARQLLGWQAERDLQQMCDDAWRWQSANPKGYR